MTVRIEHSYCNEDSLFNCCCMKNIPCTDVDIVFQIYIMQPGQHSSDDAQIFFLDRFLNDQISRQLLQILDQSCCATFLFDIILNKQQEKGGKVVETRTYVQRPGFSLKGHTGKLVITRRSYTLTHTFMQSLAFKLNMKLAIYFCISFIHSFKMKIVDFHLECTTC